MGDGSVREACVQRGCQMKWQVLPGPAFFLDGVVQLLREGMSVVVAAPSRGTPEIGAGVCDLLAAQRWSFKHLVVSTQQDPLQSFSNVMSPK